MNIISNNMFSLGKKTHVKAFQKEVTPMDSGLYTNRKQKEAIGKPFFMDKKMQPNYSNSINDVKQALKKARAGGTVAPAKKGFIKK